MSEPVKNGKRWRHRIMVAGVRRTGTFDTKAAALKWEAEQRVAIAKPVRGSVVVRLQLLDVAMVHHSREVK